MAMSKHPSEVLDYRFEWGKCEPCRRPWLEEGDKIVAAVVDYSGVTEARPPVFDDTGVTVWVAGGVLKTRPRVTVQITTEMGRKPIGELQLIIE